METHRLHHPTKKIKSEKVATIRSTLDLSIEGVEGTEDKKGTTLRFLIMLWKNCVAELREIEPPSTRSTIRENKLKKKMNSSRLKRSADKVIRIQKVKG